MGRSHTRRLREPLRAINEQPRAATLTDSMFVSTPAYSSRCFGRSSVLISATALRELASASPTATHSTVR